MRFRYDGGTVLLEAEETSAAARGLPGVRWDARVGAFRAPGSAWPRIRDALGDTPAEGIRSTVTIPAGEIGNERPIDIVSERWYSPELQVVLSMRHSDPRFGENHYYLTNIRRGEPPASLFEVPSDSFLAADVWKVESARLVQA